MQLNLTPSSPKVAQQLPPVVKKETETPPVQKPKPKPKLKPKPIVEKKIPAKTKPVEKKPVPAETAPQVIEEPEPVVTSQPSPPKAQPKANLLEQYMAELLASIEKKKRYPAIARRKNIEGRVRVHFVLTCDGQISGLDINGSHSLLRKATNKAIKAAHPFPHIPSELSCPLPITYAMAYTLDQ
ncbi:MAG: TonB family protein [Candidatus Thiodiazotropha sp. LLP2]